VVIVFNFQEPVRLVEICD